jgi:hypothetical protein
MLWTKFQFYHNITKNKSSICSNMYRMPLALYKESFPVDMLKIKGIVEEKSMVFVKIELNILMVLVFIYFGCTSLHKFNEKISLEA